MPIPPRPAIPRITWSANSVPGCSSDIRQPAVDVARVAQADDRAPGEPLRERAAAAGLLGERVAEQRLAAPDGVPPRFRVAVPELLVTPGPVPRAADQAREPDAGRKVEPDDRVGAVDHVRADLARVVAVDHPAVLFEDRREDRLELVIGRLGPVRAVDQRVELDEAHAEAGRDGPSQCRLPVATGRGDDRDATHGASVP